MENFFERVGRVWPSARRDLHWHVLPSAAESQALLSAYPAAAFSGPGLARVPAEWMHCTLLHAVGLTAQAADVDALVEEARALAASTAPFTLTFDRPAIGPVAVEISGWPGAPFTQLVDALTYLTHQHAHGPFTPAPSRYPHLSIAYTTRGAEHIDPAGLRHSLAQLDGPLTHTVHVGRIHLVEQYHDGETIRWTSLASLPLEGHTHG